MRKTLLQVFIVLVGLGGLNAGLFSGCKASLVKDAAKNGVVPIKTKTALNKCITDPKLAADNPNFVATLEHTCTTDEKFKAKFSKACRLAAKAAGGGDEEEEEAAPSKGRAGKGDSGKDGGSQSSRENDQEGSSEKTCTCICQMPAPQAPVPQAQVYSQPQPTYDPYYGQQQQYQQQYQQPQYGYPVQ